MKRRISIRLQGGMAPAEPHKLGFPCSNRGPAPNFRSDVPVTSCGPIDPAGADPRESRLSSCSETAPACSCGQHVKTAPLPNGWLLASPAWLAVTHDLCPGCYFFQLAAAAACDRQKQPA